MKTRFCSFLLLLPLIHSQLFAQFIHPEGSRSSALAGASVNSADAWSLLNNQAGLAGVRSLSCGISYENRYIPLGMGSQTLIAALPVRRGTFGTRVSYSGNSTYRQYFTGLAYARGFGSRLNVGVMLDLFYEGLPEPYGHSFIPSCELGLQLRISEALQYGLHLYNPGMSRIDRQGAESYPVIIRSGFSYHFNKDFRIHTEASKSSGFPIEFHLGFEYLPGKQLVTRWGIATEPFRYSFGFGYTLGFLETDIGVQHHESLGFSPQVSLLYHFSQSR